MIDDAINNFISSSILILKYNKKLCSNFFLFFIFLVILNKIITSLYLFIKKKKIKNEKMVGILMISKVVWVFWINGYICLKNEKENYKFLLFSL